MRMKAEKLKRWIIKKAGGYTKDEFKNALFKEPIIKQYDAEELHCELRFIIGNQIADEDLAAYMCRKISEQLTPYLEFEQCENRYDGTLRIRATLRVLVDNSKRGSG